MAAPRLRPSSDPRGTGVPRADSPSCELKVKAVPGSRREEIVGWLGGRLKVKVAAPPEEGRANRALCDLLARTLGVPSRALSVVSGHSSPAKVVRIEGLREANVRERLGRADPEVREASGEDGPGSDAGD